MIANVDMMEEIRREEQRQRKERRLQRNVHAAFDFAIVLAISLYLFIESIKLTVWIGQFTWP